MASDRELIQIVDAALAASARKSGSWLACRPGCDHCCYGPFEISQLDAERLRQGLSDLEQSDPSRAARLLDRVRAAHVARSSEGGPTEDDPCPVLDPDSRTCDLYQARPITCRAFGPPVQCESGVGICELCFVGASDEVIAANIVTIDPDNLESVLIEELAQSTGLREMTTVARCLLR